MKKQELTEREIHHLIILLDQYGWEETCYGNKDQYWKRSHRIRYKLKSLLPNSVKIKSNPILKPIDERF